MKILIPLTILINLIKLSIQVVPCGSYLPKDTASCTASSTPDNYCCLLQAYVNSVMVTTCYPIERYKYLALQDKMILNDITYNVDCGYEMGTNCGNIYSPVSYKDCGKFSIPGSSCCFFKYREDTGCIWLGGGQAGIVEENGLSIICGENYIKLPIIIFLLILALF